MYRLPPADLHSGKTSAIRLEISLIISISGILKKTNKKYLKFMKCEHISARRRPKSGPTPNRDQLRVFYNADEKTGYILIFFNYYRKVHSTAILTSRGTTFLGDVAPKMCSHFTNFKYFLIWVFSKCQKMYRGYRFPLEWRWFCSMHDWQGAVDTSVALRNFTERAPHM